jgi:hypothetical protein
MDPTSFYRIVFILSICINLILLVSLYLSRYTNQVIVDDNNNNNNELTVQKKKSELSFLDIADTKISHLSCNDPLWCNIPMPSSSFFNFDPPTNFKKWKQSQAWAAEGKQVKISSLLHSAYLYSFLI